MRLSLHLFCVTLVFAVATPIIYAQTYGEGNYGECEFGECAPTAPAEESEDPDPEPKILAEKDTDSDGENEQFIDEDGDGSPDTYTDPNDGISGPVVVDEDENGEEIWYFDIDGDGDIDSSYNPITQEVSTLATEEDPIELQEQIDQGEDPLANPDNAESRDGDRALTSGGFGGAAYQSIGEALQEIPEPVARSIPILLLIMLGAAGIRFIWQERWEIKRTKQTLAYIEHQKQLFFEKNNFVMLVSHYLRTPLTKIKSGFDMVQSAITNSPVVATLGAAVQKVETNVNSILDDVTKDPTLQSIKQTQASSSVVIARSAPRFVIPVVLVVLLALFVRFILIDFRIPSGGWLQTVSEIAFAVLMVQWFFSALRKRQLAQQNRLDQEEQMHQQEAIDAGRNRVIESGRQDLRASLQQLEQSLSQVQNENSRFIKEGAADLGAVTTKFAVLSNLNTQALAAEAQKLSLYGAISEVEEHHKAKVEEKQLQITNSTSHLPEIVQNKALLQYVISAVLENSINYSSNGGSITFSGSFSNGLVTLEIEDNGEGIPKDKINTILKPFTRAENAEDFTREGLGFSLYLSRVIMRYLGGDLQITSRQGEGTKVAITFAAQLEG